MCLPRVKSPTHLKKQQCEVSCYLVAPDDVSLPFRHFRLGRPSVGGHLFVAKSLDRKSFGHDFQAACGQLLLFQTVKLGTVVEPEEEKKHIKMGEREYFGQQRK